MRPAKPSPHTGAHSGPRVVAQVHYAETPAALSSAARIVARASRNRASLLRKFLRYQKRYPQRARELHASIFAIDRVMARVLDQLAQTRQVLFLLEARAAHAYWKGIGTLLTPHVNRWTRAYPHARDPVNLLLNTGYTFLARWVREAVHAAGLLPEIGVLHATAGGKEPLVYDLMELFRQPAIDAVVLPLFTKKKRPVTDLHVRDMRRAVAKFHRQWNSHVWYHGRCETLRQIAYHEALALSRAMQAGGTWEPYQHPWGHAWTCSSYRVPDSTKKRLRDEAAERKE